MRGFAPSGIGPRDVASPALAKTSALGGTTYFGGSLEVQFPIPLLPRELGMRGAVFADAGTLFNFAGGRATALGGCPAGSTGRFFDVNRNGAVDIFGNVGGVSEVACVRDKNIIRTSVGASLLWNSPLGPIRFDYAFALTKDKGLVAPNGVRYGGDVTQAFRFSGGTRF